MSVFVRDIGRRVFGVFSFQAAEKNGVAERIAAWQVAFVLF